MSYISCFLTVAVLSQLPKNALALIARFANTCSVFFLSFSFITVKVKD